LNHKLRIRLLCSHDQSTIESILDFIGEAVTKVNIKPKPDLMECPGHDGDCKGCKPCVCHEYY